MDELLSEIGDKLRLLQSQYAHNKRLVSLTIGSALAPP